MSWVRKNRFVLFIGSALIIFILAGSISYILFAHKIVESWYKGKPFLFWKGMKESEKAPIEEFYKKADAKFGWLLFSSLAFTVFFSLFGIWIRNITKKRLILTTAIFLFLIIGLFLLNSFKVGLFTFEKSARSLQKKIETVHKQALSFEQEDVLDKLGANAINGFCYRFDDHLKEARVDIQTAPEDQESSFPEEGLRFEFDGADQHKFELKKGEVVYEKGILKLTYTEADYFENSGELNIDKETIGEMEIRIKLAKGKRIYLGWSKHASIQKEDFNDCKISIDTLPDSTFHIYKINATNILKRGLLHGDIIKKVFLFPSDVPGDEIEIDYFRLVPKKAKYSENSIGNVYETINKEMRKAIFGRTPCALIYAIEIPEKECFLDFGMGVLESRAPVTFRIVVESQSRRKEVFSQEIPDNTAWHDSRIDFSEWAGKPVEVSFQTESKEGNIGFWSNPVLYTSPPEKLNIIIVLEDALRADYLSCYNQAVETTPTKDRFFEDGILFLNAYSQATETRPSLATIMTSLYPSATGVWNFFEFLDEKYLTIAEIMRHQGFETGSFFQNSNAGPYAGLHQGFSCVFDEESVGTRAREIYGDRLSTWLELNKNRNIFLYVHLLDPHGPYDPPPPFDSWYKEAGPGKTLVGRKNTLDPENVAVPTMEGRRLLYEGEVRYNDHHFSQFLNMLEKHDLQRDTVVIFMADHGEHLGEHDLWGHFPPGLRQGIHVPLAIVFPRELPRNKKIVQAVQLIDVMPTILDLARINKENLLLAGDSLMPLIRGENLLFWENRLAVSEEVLHKKKSDKREWGSVFYQKWHFINSDFFVKSLKPLLLPRFFEFISMKAFHVLRNKSEEKSLDSFYADLIFKYRIKRLLGRSQETNLKIWKTMTGGAQNLVQYDPEVQERLRALGYIR